MTCCLRICPTAFQVGSSICYLFVLPYCSVLLLMVVAWFVSLKSFIFVASFLRKCRCLGEPFAFSLWVLVLGLRVLFFCDISFSMFCTIASKRCPWDFGVDLFALCESWGALLLLDLWLVGCFFLFYCCPSCLVVTVYIFLL